jgi:hypothetical protein
MTESHNLHTIKAHTATAVAAGGTVYAADQLVKSFEKDDHSTSEHLLKAGVGAAVAVGALELLHQDQGGMKTYRKLFKRKYHQHHLEADQSRTESIHSSTAEEVDDRRLVRRERASSSSRSSSVSSDESGHKRRLAEELVGAYSLGKQLLGDKKHHVAHLVADAVGAAALLKEVYRHDIRNSSRY